VRLASGAFYKTIFLRLFTRPSTLELSAKVRNLPFDRLRVNGVRLKLFSFSVRGELVEPQKKLLQEAPYILYQKRGSSGGAGQLNSSSHPLCEGCLTIGPG
jgi:hypothetical protein